MKIQTIIFSLIVVLGLTLTSTVFAEEGVPEIEVDSTGGTEVEVTIPTEPVALETDTVGEDTTIISTLETDTVGEQKNSIIDTLETDTVGGQKNSILDTIEIDTVGGSSKTDNDPVITLIGSGSITIELGDSTFSDEGATATDIEDGDITSKIVTTGSVDYDKEGVQSITYTVTDSDGNTVSVTRTVTVEKARQGGGGGGSSRTRSSSNTGGSVLGATTPELPEQCGIYLNDYLRYGANNNPVEVIKLQLFLNEYVDAGLSVNGTFDLATFEAVKELQATYADEILAPWVEAGFVDTLAPTGFVYQTTKYFINLRKCEELNIQFPELMPATTVGYTPASVTTATGGAVLGDVTFSGDTCGIYLYDYLRKGDANDPVEVKKLQTFLNDFIDADISVNGVFDDATDTAVRNLQARYADEILQPWVDAGITVSLDTTGYVYKTTQYFINTKMCPELNLAFPDLN